MRNYSKFDEINLDSEENHGEHVFSIGDLQNLNFDSKIKKLRELVLALPKTERRCLSYSLKEATIPIIEDYDLPFPIMKILTQFYEALAVAIHPEQESSLSAIKERLT